MKLWTANSSGEIKTHLTGTEKQVGVAYSGNGNVVLSTPQDIDIDSDVVFSKVTTTDFTVGSYTRHVQIPVALT